jgi:hypothetical protein
METVDRYLRVFEDLRSKKRWATDTNILRFAALTLAAADIDDPGGRLEAAAATLKKRAGWTGQLNSPIRYVVAAMILRKGLRPARVHDAVEAVRREFRNRKYRRGGVSELLAALLLVLQNDGKLPRAITVDRVGTIMKRWKEDHRFLTGIDDYPMAALHAWRRDQEVETIGARVEKIYRLLRKNKCSMGNATQLASHILALGTWDEHGAARRFTAIRKAFKDRGRRIGPSQYDEVALLALTEGTPVAIATRVLADVERLRAAKPRPETSIAFSLAAGIALSREIERHGDAAVSPGAAALAAAKSLLDAQAAAMAAMAASVAVTTVATSSAAVH